MQPPLVEVKSTAVGSASKDLPDFTSGYQAVAAIRMKQVLRFGKSLQVLRLSIDAN